jgi:hypothetical protein
MSALKNLLEPGCMCFCPVQVPPPLTSTVIVLAFTIGTLVNRHRLRQSNDDESSPLLPRSENLETADTPVDPDWVIAIKPDNSRFGKNTTSRFLTVFPFLTEIGYWNLTYWTYQLARAFSAVHIRNHEEIYDRSRGHALSILAFERNYHFSIEQQLQEWIMKHIPWLFQVLSVIYYSHIVVSVSFLAYTYTYFPRRIFQPIRRTMAGCNLVAFLILTAYRVMPPRMLPDRYGFVDVLHPEDGDSEPSWTHNKYQLTIAAMPSLHFGIAVLIGWCLFHWSPHRAIRILACFWPAVMLFTILATANHFLVDAFVGALVPTVSWVINDSWLVLRPLEEWIYWICRTEKPLAADQDPLWLQKNRNEDDVEDGD